MKKSFKSIIAALSAVSVLSFGGITASATTADDVVAAARGAGIRSDYVIQLENFLYANDFNSNQYDMMIEGLGGIRNISIDVIKRYLPEVESIDDLFGGGSSGGSDENSGENQSSEENDSTYDDLPEKDKEKLNEITDKIEENMTNEQMLDVIQQVIDTGKKLGLDVTVEQNGEKNFTMTVKDKDGNIKLVAPIGKVVSKTGAEAGESGTDFAGVAAVSASVLAAGCIGAWVLGRKNRGIGE